MILLNKLKATCPHCQHRFFRFKTEKSIKFCPSCELSLLKVKKVEKKTTIKELILLFLIYFFLAYLLLSRSDYPVLQNLLNNIPSYWYAFVLIMIFLLALIPTLLAKSHTTKAGVDNLDNVQADIEGYEISSDYDDPNYLTRCPNCTSQRLQGLYWYKKNLINNKIDITRSNYAQQHTASDDLVGCLHCHHCFLNIANPDKQSLKEGGKKFLAVVILMALWFCSAYIFSLDITDLPLMSSTDSLTNPVIYIIKAGLISIILLSITPFQKIMHNNPPPKKILKPLNSNELNTSINNIEIDV